MLRSKNLPEAFLFLEGPVWVRKGGYLISATSPATSLTSGTPQNWKDHHVLQPSGFHRLGSYGCRREQTNGKAVAVLNYGSNGITLDSSGPVVLTPWETARSCALKKRQQTV